jgi:hypothetical protein
VEQDGAADLWGVRGFIAGSVERAKGDGGDEDPFDDRRPAHRFDDRRPARRFDDRRPARRFSPHHDALGCHLRCHRA